MGEGDLMPAGRRRKKPLNQKKLQKIKEGWKKAEKIREKAVTHHKEHEIPAAEDELLKDLDKIEDFVPLKPR